MSLRCVAADSIYANNANRKFSMQFQTAVEYQLFADRWFKCCVRLTLDLVSALNSWWNSGSSFGLSFFKLRTLLFGAFSCFYCIQSSWFASLV